MKNQLLCIVMVMSGLFFFAGCSSSIESDAKKAAKLMCEAYQNSDRSISLTIQAEEIIEKYTGANKLKFEELAEKEYEKCLKTIFKSSSNSEIMNMGNDDESEDYEFDEIEKLLEKEASEEVPSENVIVIGLTDRVYFYTEPDYSTKRKAYFLKGEKATMLTDKDKDTDDDFIYVLFDKNGKISEGFVLSNEVRIVQSTQKNNDNSISSTPSSSLKGSNDIDIYLKSYEEYVDQYIKLMKKAKDGDMSTLMEYTEYMEKATDLSDKMEKAESEMTSAQMAKFLKIQAKLTNAVANMY